MKNHLANQKNEKNSYLLGKIYFQLEKYEESKKYFELCHKYEEYLQLEDYWNGKFQKN